MRCTTLVLGLLLVACSSKHENATNEHHAPSHLYFVPDSVTKQLGGANVLFAIDFRALKNNPLLRMIPQDAGCVRDLAATLGVVVVTDGSPFNAYATHLSQENTKDCLEIIVRALGGTTKVAQDGTYQIQVHDVNVSLVWRDGVMIATPVGRPPPSTAADPEMRELASAFQADVVAFLLMKHTPDGSVGDIVMTLRELASSFEISLRGEGKTAADAQRFWQDVLDGIREGAAEHHIMLDDTWFEQKTDGNKLTVTARIPLSALPAAPTEPPAPAGTEPPAAIPPQTPVKTISIASGDGAAAAAVAVQYTHAMATRDVASVCATRATSERAEMAKLAGSCEAAFRAVIGQQPVDQLGKLLAKTARRRGNQIAIDLVLPGGTDPQLTLIATHEDFGWLLVDLPDDQSF